MKNAISLKINVFNNGELSLSLGQFDNDNTPTALYQKAIEHYIGLFNVSKVYIPNKLFYGQSIDVYLSYYSNTYLFSSKHGNNENQYHSFSGYEKNEEKSCDTYDRPIIHLTYGNIINGSSDFQKEPYKRYARFMDSSIWNYYVPILLKNKYAPRFSDNRYDFSPLKHAILSILNNYTYCICDKKIYSLYQLRVAREYAHLFSRIVNQSFLPDISGHGKNVSPFLFHSERKSFEDLKNEEHTKVLSKIKEFKWRFLLVDDHSTEKMAVVGGEATLTKLDIVKTELEKLYKNIKKDNKPVIIASEKDTEDIKKDATIYIECASSIEEAKSKLSRKKYEIILLDYLLGDKDGGGREYGYELLKLIYDKENGIDSDDSKDFNYKKGPDNRFFFMFISAFTTAVSERLLTEGWLRSEDYWYIGEGACPINTPYLFQYRLLHIMEKRMKDMGLTDMLGVNNNDFKKSYIKEKIIDVIFDSSTNVRKSANDKFKDVLSLLYSYKNLLLDTHNVSNPFDSPESSLATAIVMKNAYIGGFLEHLTQLVYLTAFGTVRQWPEMWEEYQFIKTIVGEIDSVEKYIFDLKNNNI